MAENDKNGISYIRICFSATELQKLIITQTMFFIVYKDIASISFYRLSYAEGN
jgi:hypothetical protein